MAPPGRGFSQHPTQVSSRLVSTFREFRVSLPAQLPSVAIMPFLLRLGSYDAPDPLGASASLPLTALIESRLPIMKINFMLAA
ncbi:hypothetical protein IE4771_PC00338 (plasmid) [Rhizobium etli bv. mimosae str. IE4771]|uniref:Uncharacterized protein n=1 Tax=Rhizobium etli bv. mimosae str. IE4771 TaxID=1432050 RepID=A0A060I602_RHIET|nr:hypothetical protein IE4771_PC00338 [Rhizobium sp. IE4771]